jgi:serine/threonine-protein kinase RIO1
MARLDFSTGQPLSQGYQAEVRRFASGQTGWASDLVIKAPAGRGLRRWISAKGLQREFAAYCRLGQMAGVPTCHGLASGRHLILDAVEGQRLSDVTARPSEAFYASLLTLIQSLHARGVAHGDLKRKDNILITPAGQPVIIDFGTAVLQPHGWHPLKRRLFNFLRQTDLNAWIKLKYGGYTGLSAADQTLLYRSSVERLASAIARARRAKP